MQGTIKWYSEKKAFGFIVREDNGKDIFVHRKGILPMSFRILKEGDKVSFDIEQGEKGPNAINVTVV